MKVKLSIICLFALMLLFQSEAYISINIDPEDLDRVSDFFHAIIINEQSQTLMHIPTRCIIIKWIKKMVFGMIQLISVMLALVGSNIISSKLIPDCQVQQQQNYEPETVFQTRNKSSDIIAKYVEMCDFDFGCDRNLCWRSCNRLVQGKKLWCHASPHARDFQRCNDSNDCHG